jgi:hypothetical protein
MGMRFPPSHQNTSPFSKVSELGILWSSQRGNAGSCDASMNAEMMAA